METLTTLLALCEGTLEAPTGDQWCRTLMFPLLLEVAGQIVELLVIYDSKSVSKGVRFTPFWSATLSTYITRWTEFISSPLFSGVTKEWVMSCDILSWKPKITIVPTVIILTTYGAPSDDNFGVMTSLGFQHLCVKFPLCYFLLLMTQSLSNSMLVYY